DNARVYQGGPVEPQAVLALAEFADPSDAVSLAFDEIGFVSSDPDVEALRDGVRQARVFAGYAGWSPGQLEEELAEDAWIVEPARGADIFADDADQLWASVLRRRGAVGTMLAMMPHDPSVN
ncbi:MAG: YqgE/AlgH family protein, partial [Gaiellaceae bacterium]